MQSKQIIGQQKAPAEITGDVYGENSEASHVQYIFCFSLFGQKWAALDVNSARSVSLPTGGVGAAMVTYHLASAPVYSLCLRSESLVRFHRALMSRAARKDAAN